MMALLGEAEIPFDARCAASVSRGKSNVIGARIFTRCVRPPVFLAPNGQYYCALHAKEFDEYTPKPQPQLWMVFFTRRQDETKDVEVVKARTEKGAQRSVPKRHFTVDGVIPYPYESARAFALSPEFQKWKGHLRNWRQGWGI